MAAKVPTFAGIHEEQAAMTDLEIARAATPRPIGAVAERLGIASDAIEPYGRYKAKLPLELLREEHIENARLVLVTALSPTPAGEGKTTTTVGLTDGLNHIGVRAAAALREPSLGPVFGMKGGAAGGGRAQVVPMEDINLHFTGDFAAVEKANNLLSALIDNAIASTKSTLGLDPRSVVWKRVMDMNDRALRSIVTGLGGKSGGVPMEAGFNITAASEVMAILCMARDLADLNARLERIYVGDRFDRTAVTAGDLEAAGAMTLLLRDAIRPNLVQTLEHSPAFIHGGPFANIAQGTNSLLATKMAMSYADWVVTEAGFGADLGAEKFLNLKCRAGGIAPRVAVVVATVRALKYHGGVRLADLGTPDADAVRRGLPNLERHLESLAGFGLPVVVALNAFASDAPEEQAAVLDACAALGVPAALNRSWALGGEGAVDLAAAVVAAASPTPISLRHTYALEDDLQAKIHAVATQIYGADGVDWAPKAATQAARFAQLGLDRLPICMAKTQKSLTDDESRLGRPTGFRITVREFEVAAGAGFLIPITGSMLRMPGLPDRPASAGMRVDPDGTVHGLA
jgi:formate--tetrahydrofolate ligase